MKQYHENIHSTNEKAETQLHEITYSKSQDSNWQIQRIGSIPSETKAYVHS